MILEYVPLVCVFIVFIYS